jgi:hypothetical protein
MTNARTPSDLNSPPRRVLAYLCLYALVFVSLLILYGLTCQRELSWQDSGMFQWRILHGDYHGDLGLALAHPLYIALGQLVAAIPVGSVFWRINFLSGVGMAIAAANVASAVYAFTGRRDAGLAAGWILGVSHIAWWLGTIAEVYTWSAAGLSAELLLLLFLMNKPTTPKLAALAVVNGVGIAIHNFALLAIPIYLAVAVVLITRKKLPAWSLATAMGGWAAGASWYLGMIVQAAGTLESWSAAVHSALFGRYESQVLSAAPTGNMTKINLVLASLSFVSFLLPLAIYGWTRLVRKAPRIVSAAVLGLTVVHFLFFIRYPVPDQFTFLLPTATMAAFAAGIGVAALLGGSWRMKAAGLAMAIASIVLPPIVYGAGPWLVDRAGVEIRRERDLMYRDEVRYWLVPWKHNEQSAHRYSAHALQQAAPDGLIFADSTTIFPLLMTKERNPEEWARVSVRPGNQSGNLAELSSTELQELSQTQGLYTVRPSLPPLPDETRPLLEIRRAESQPLHEVVWSGPSSR